MKTSIPNRLTHLFLVAAGFLLAASLTATSANAQRVAGSVGIGGQIGTPSGLNVKVYNPGSTSLDFLAAWDVDDLFFVNAHWLYERHLGQSQRSHLFFGPGGFVGIQDNADEDGDEAVLGFSGSLGVGHLFDRFEVYAQVTPRIAVSPDTDGAIGGGLGFRYYF